MDALRSLRRLIVTLVVAGAAGPAWGEAREANALRLRQAVRTSGVNPGPDFDRKLANLSDRQIEELVAEHAQMGYDESPLAVIAGALLLLVLFVWLVVSLVD